MIMCNGFVCNASREDDLGSGGRRLMAKKGKKAKEAKKERKG